MPHDRQSAASLGTIKCKGANDEMPARADRLPCASDIGGLIGLFGEEMEGRAVVPEIVRPRADSIL